MAVTTHTYRFNDGRTVEVDHDDSTPEDVPDRLTYRLDDQTITDPDQVAALITEFRRTG